MSLGSLFPFLPMRDALDYNRALALPIRLVHAALAPILASIHYARFSPSPQTAWAHRALLFAAALLAAKQIDPLLEGGAGIGIGGDVRRELEAWQQFGGITSIIVIAVVIASFEVRSKWRVITLLLAPAIASVLCLVTKMLIGRTRPKHCDHELILGPVGVQPIEHDGSVTLVHAWELGTHGHNELWSFPSSHTASAAAIAVVLACMYPKLRTLVWVLAGIVAFGRMATGAHYATDVVGGAAAGLAAGTIALRLTDRKRQTVLDVSL